MGYAFAALLYHFYIKSEFPIRFYNDLGASTALLMRFYCALAVSVTIRVILTKLSNRSGIAVQWNGGLRNEFNFWNVHGNMNTSGLLQSNSSFTLTLQETRSIHDSVNRLNIEFIFYIYILL